MNKPTTDNCNNKAIVYEDKDRIGYACWYPQMGGYVGMAIAVFDKEHSEGIGGCIDVYVWHDGEFPFSEGNPRELHHCDPTQFIEFGNFLNDINSKNLIRKNDSENIQRSKA